MVCLSVDFFGSVGDLSGGGDEFWSGFSDDVWFVNWCEVLLWWILGDDERDGFFRLRR